MIAVFDFLNILILILFGSELHTILQLDNDVTSTFSQDIYSYLREQEVKFMAKHNYMIKQSDISHSMRSILVDWLVEVGEEYKLQTETLYLAVSYIDR